MTTAFLTPAFTETMTRWAVFGGIAGLGWELASQDKEAATGAKFLATVVAMVAVRAMAWHVGICGLIGALGGYGLADEARTKDDSFYQKAKVTAGYVILGGLAGYLMGCIPSTILAAIAAPFR